jgi:hypothetical protein
MFFLEFRKAFSPHLFSLRWSGLIARHRALERTYITKDGGRRMLTAGGKQSGKECWWENATTPESRHPDPLALGFRHVILALFCLPLIMLRCTWIATNCNVFCICLQARMSSPSTNPPSPFRQPTLCCLSFISRQCYALSENVKEAC